MKTTPPPENQMNVLLAIVLSMAVLLVWSYFFSPLPKAPSPDQKIPPRIAETEKASTPQLAQTPIPQAATREQALTASSRLPIETPSLKGSLSLKGGAIDDLSLVKYRETVNPKSPNIILFSPLTQSGGYFARFGWESSNSNTKVPDAETLWTSKSKSPLTPEAPATLEWTNGDGLTFRRIISVDNDYMFTIVEEVENQSTTDVALKPYARLFRFGAPKTASVWIQHEGLLAVPGDAGLQEITFANATSEPPHVFDAKKGGWLGITDKYWGSAVIPDQTITYRGTLQGEGAQTPSQMPLFLAEYEIEPLLISKNSTSSVKTMLYAGAKRAEIVENYAAQLGIEKFDLMIDWGWFYFLTKPMNHALSWLYGILGNFGFAILALTVIVKLLFFPLANKSYISMARMKKLQPEMETLRERYKDDKARMQQELMQLYKKEKINPAAGCLPVIVQIPVFFALYKVLYTSIDMRHAPFIGWIKDLSAPDPTSIFNLFGLLPFAVPELLHLGVWPIIMGITMWIQMQLNPPQPDPIQQQIFSWMPLMFTFLLGTFPAGLVIYWAWNNVLSILQQWYITTQQGAEVHLIPNLKRNFSPLIKLLSAPKKSN
ncbi:MAG: membrane protein insertase YidC [Hyphomicrobium sp.]